jgi:hypothetical protein
MACASSYDPGALIGPTLANCSSLSSSAPAASVCIPQWQARTGTSLDDEIHAMVRDTDGNVYVGGFENGILHVANDWPVGNAVGVVEKRSKIGQLLWRHVFEVPLSTTLVEAIEIDAARNRLIVVGRTSGSFPGYANHGQFDLFVVQLQIENGLQIALTQDGGMYPEHPGVAAVLPSGYIVVAGYTDTFVQGSAVLGQPTMFMARYERQSASSPLLSLKWRLQPNQPMPLSSISYAYSAVPAGLNNEDVIVSTKSLTSLANGGGNRVARIDENGGMIWNKLVSPASLDIAIALAATSSGRVYVVGTTGISLAGPALGNFDGFLMERDSATGNLI